jgi:hypothetical protein
MRWIALVLCAAAALSPARAEAQNYERIRVDFGLIGGYASGINEGGFGGVVEPKLVVTDNIGVALRLEGMVTFGASVGGDDTSFGTGSVGLLGLKSEYLVGTFDVRPVVGLGAGLYAIGGDTIDSGPDQVVVSHKSGRYFGVSPSVGIDLGRVRLSATYNLIFGADIEVDQMVGGSTTRRDFSQNYFTFELSFHVGGSRVKRAPASAR